MKKTSLIAASLSALALTASSMAFACEADSKTQASAEKAAGFKLIHVAELASLQKAKKVSVYDANGDETRAKYGVIPGATLLANLKYDTKILPADKAQSLVFYCANTQCNASHQAAERATAAGHTNVSVLSDGIMGWAKSGQPTSKLPNS